MSQKRDYFVDRLACRCPVTVSKSGENYAEYDSIDECARAFQTKAMDIKRLIFNGALSGEFAFDITWGSPYDIILFKDRYQVIKVEADV